MRLCPYPVRPYLAAWGVGCLYNITHDLMSAPLAMALVFNAAHFALWALLGLAAIPLLRRWPLTRSPLSWLRQLGLGAAFTMVDITLGHWIGMHWLGLAHGLSLAGVAAVAFHNCFHIGLLNYGLMLAVVQLLDARRREHARRAREAALESTWAEARLRQLRSQLQPHFLFNALHTVGALMRHDLAAAERVLDQLSRLLRLALRETDQPLVYLRIELAFVEAYCEIERARFEDRLQVALEVPAALLEARIPPLILQPLVENAIKHGVAPHPDGGRVTVRGWRDGTALVLEVRNAPLAAACVRPAAPPRPGLGLALAKIRARLDALYGSDSSLLLLCTEGGAVARIRLPWGADAAPAHDAPALESAA